MTVHICSPTCPVFHDLGTVPDNLRCCPRREHDEYPGAIPHRRKGCHHREKRQITSPDLLQKLRGTCKRNKPGEVRYGWERGGN